MKALVPTCNRPEMFYQLARKMQGFDVIGFVNNSSPANVEKYKSLMLPENVRLVFTDISGEPKECHVHTFRLMMDFTESETLIVEDDVDPIEKFHSQLMQRIEAIKKHYPNFTLSPLYLPLRNSDFYTGGKSHPVRIDGFDFVNQAWVDGNFYMTEEVMAEMRKWIQKPVSVYHSSSGIGRRNSSMIASHGWPMFTTVPTLVEHLDQYSVMFGERRKQVPLIARFGVR